MFKQKDFTGTYPEYTAAVAAVKIPGLTNTLNVNKTLTALYGRCLAEFLTDCGCSAARFDEENCYVWIHGAPYLFAIGNAFAAANIPYAIICIPFRSTVFYQGGFGSAVSGTSQAFASFYFNTSTKGYKLRFRIVGDVNTAFSLVLFSYAYRYRANTSASWATTFQIESPAAVLTIQFAKGRDILRENDVRFISVNAGNQGNCIELDSQGGLVDIGYSTANLIFPSVVLETRAKEAEDAPGKLLLMKHHFLFFEIEGVYMYPRNAGLPAGVLHTADNAVFITVNGVKYWAAAVLSGLSAVPAMLGLVKCPTPD